MQWHIASLRLNVPPLKFSPNRLQIENEFRGPSLLLIEIAGKVHSCTVYMGNGSNLRKGFLRPMNTGVNGQKMLVRQAIDPPDGNRAVPATLNRWSWPGAFIAPNHRRW